ncbi:hypothetical protein L7G72_12395 [Xenorhabdus bovienii]|uniref:hypothetical protein n=1 Tax=Xenorhabdus bovienii TaxID=40576 RepID=UPI001EDD44AE|nr:hypothetical protein [Xenorhabdus bovienii]MCG3462638.1 hypothetical protein [Xenorhabdus bovienii]
MSSINSKQAGRPRSSSQWHKKNWMICSDNTAQQPFRLSVQTEFTASVVMKEENRSAHYDLP